MFKGEYNSTLIFNRIYRRQRITNLTPPHWVVFTQAGNELNWYKSGNGKDWNSLASSVNDPNYANLRHVGIGSETDTVLFPTLYGLS